MMDVAIVSPGWRGVGRAAAWCAAPAVLALMILMSLGHESFLLGDFRAFYCAGVALTQGADPYREEPLRSCEIRAGAPAEPKGLHAVALPAPLPPYALAAYTPFARLPFTVAGALYLALLVAAMAAATQLLARITGVS
jgi:hypothetical protein